MPFTNKMSTYVLDSKAFGLQQSNVYSVFGAQEHWDRFPRRPEDNTAHSAAMDSRPRGQLRVHLHVLQ